MKDLIERRHAELTKESLSRVYRMVKESTEARPIELRGPFLKARQSLLIDGER